MKKSSSRQLDYLELNPPSSPALMKDLEDVLSRSERWNAALESLDRHTGTYRIIVEGTLGDQPSSN